MSAKTFYSRRSHGEQKLLTLDGQFYRREQDTDCLQQFSCCPACKKEYESVLILPCSHTMCVHCIVAEIRLSESHHHRISLPDCSVQCPGCRHPVELPCWNWSSATSCLPQHPILSRTCDSRKTASQDQLPQGNTLSRVDGDKTAQSCLHSSNAGSSSTAPVDGIVDLQEEEMEKSVFGLCFALDRSTVPSSLHLSTSALTITYKGESPSGPLPGNKLWTSMTSDPTVRLALPQVCADAVIAQGQYYWEVDVCNSTVYRIGVRTLDGSGGWWLQRYGLSFCAVYDGCHELLTTVPPQIKTLGVFLNIGGGTLSFHNPLTQEHLATLPTRFNRDGVLPALGLGQGRLRLRCGLPPPPHVFVSKDSAYRGPCGASGDKWRREIPFQSVRKVIQKFEELAVSDSDSGLVSSFGSSCTTLASIPDLGISGMFSSGRAEQGAEAQ